MKPSGMQRLFMSAGVLCVALQAQAAPASPTAARKPAAAASTARVVPPKSTVLHAKTAVAPVLPPLSAQQIIDKHIAARGGAAAWKAVAAITFKGSMGAGGTTYEAVSAKRTLERKERPEMLLPFTLTLKRPHSSRLELTFDGLTSVQVYDGAAGYKYRPFMGRTDWEPYTADELKLAAAEPGMDGLLADAANNHRHVESAGTDRVDGNPAYRLRVTRADGKVLRVWVDAKSFLEVKEDGAPRKLDSRMHPVSVYLKDYKPEQGLMIAHVIETDVEGVAKPEKISIESVQVNPRLDDVQFTKPK